MDIHEKMRREIARQNKQEKARLNRKPLSVNIKTKDTVDFDALKRNLLLQADRFVSMLLPGGKTRGREYLAHNPHRNDKTLGSFSINLNTGHWGDFATKDNGGDLISLYAFIKGIGNVEAAREIASEWNT